MVAELGVYIARGLARVIGFAQDILVDEVLDLPEIANEVIHNLCKQVIALHARVTVESCQAAPGKFCQRIDGFQAVRSPRNE
ncbi:hypothetical protein [Rhodophyticola sp. CCM32]|uniref:hypothetical protein n=1 Tax=Rhodophyticola sp. CCM32 TaxID=2916397 RepID=UPI001EE54C14|nr:hypothetical protein [Rhodophyticola sp. CCM32]